MNITDELVKHIASLVRIRLQDNEIPEYKNHLDKVLNHMEELNKVNTQGVDPYFSPVFDQDVKSEKVRRQDEVEPSLHVEQVMTNAPKYQQNQFVVDAVIEEN